MIVFDVVDWHMTRVDPDDMRDQGMQLAEESLGQGTHHDQPGKAGMKDAVQDLRVFKLELRLDQGQGSAQTGELFLDAAEDGEIIGIAVFSSGSGQEAAHGKARFGVRIRRKGMLPGEGLIAQLGHGAKDPFAGFVGGLI